MRRAFALRVGHRCRDIGKAVIIDRHARAGEHVRNAPGAGDHRSGRPANIVAGRADHHRHLGKAAGAIGDDAVDRDLAVDDWTGESLRPGFRREQGHHVQTVRDLFGAQRPEFDERLRIIRRDPVRPRKGDADRFGRGKRRITQRDRTAGHGHGLVEQSPCQRRRDQRVDRNAPGAFADDRDIRRVAAERGDIAPDPAQRRQLIKIAIIGQQAMIGVDFGQLRMGECAEATDAIVEADDHDSLPRQYRARICRWRCAAVQEPAAIDPHHDRQFARGACRLPDIGIKAILRRRRPKRRGIARERGLHAIMAVSAGIADARPAVRGLRCTPAQRADRRCGEGDALERRHAIDGGAAQHAGIDPDLRRRRCGSTSMTFAGHYQRRDGNEQQSQRQCHGASPKTFLAQRLTRNCRNMGIKYRCCVPIAHSPTCAAGEDARL